MWIHYVSKPYTFNMIKCFTAYLYYSQIKISIVPRNYYAWQPITVSTTCSSQRVFSQWKCAKRGMAFQDSERLSLRIAWNRLIIACKMMCCILRGVVNLTRTRCVCGDETSKWTTLCVQRMYNSQKTFLLRNASRMVHGPATAQHQRKYASSAQIARILRISHCDAHSYFILCSLWKLNEPSSPCFPFDTLWLSLVGCVVSRPSVRILYYCSTQKRNESEWRQNAVLTTKTLTAAAHTRWLAHPQRGSQTLEFEIFFFVLPHCVFHALEQLTLPSGWFSVKLECIWWTLEREIAFYLAAASCTLPICLPFSRDSEHARFL